MTTQTAKQEIKKILVQFEIANSKLVYDSSDRCWSTPAEKANVTKLYKKAIKISKANGIDPFSDEFILIHHEALKQIRENANPS